MLRESEFADDYIETEILPGIEKCRLRPDERPPRPNWDGTGSDAEDFSELDSTSDFGFEEGPMILGQLARSEAVMVGW